MNTHDHHPITLRSLLGVASFTVCYLIVSAIIAFKTANQEFLLYLLLMVGLSLLIFHIHKRIKLPHPLLWLLSLWGLLHMMGGMWVVPSTDEVLYNYWLIPNGLKYDQITHAFGFGLCTWTSWLGLKSFTPTLQPTTGPLSFSMLTGLGLGAINETIEFLVFLCVADTNVGDYQNTGWDLIYNTIGSGIALLLIPYFEKKRAGL